ncbi:MAG: glycosyltransferase [Beijerinckiaceae bacterium]|nr:glycosyltransferase [Beijerinckiaceae bacterium]
MRVAIVHDWLYVIGGAERVLGEILKCFPTADVFTLFDILSPEDRAKIGFDHARTSFLQKMPFIAKRHRSYLPLMPIAIEQFDLSAYDLVISSSYAVAKGVITGPAQIHVSYVHSPMRYAWDLQHSYLRQSNCDRGLKGVFARLLLHWMRIWDMRTANGPDAIIANSAFVARRIAKVYRRKAHVIHPPVVQSVSNVDEPRGDYFMAASRLVPYKNIDAIIRAFQALPDQKLIVVGDGPEEKHLRGLAGPNVSFTGRVSDAQMRDLMHRARAFIFAAEEDFGIIPVEAQSEGTPVLALARGGVLETVRASFPNRTGLFFATPEPDDIAVCVKVFVEEERSFSREACRYQAALFSDERFRTQFKDFVYQEMASLPPAVPVAIAGSSERIASLKIGLP